MGDDHTARANMILTVGKHRGKSVEEVVLKDPSYIAWMLSQADPSEALAQACDEARQLIGTFNGKPFVKKCSGDGCDEMATRCTVYGPNVNPWYWCDKCDPYAAGATRGNLSEIRTYWDAIQHVNFHGDGRKSSLEVLIRNLARAKGLPDRVGASQASAFSAS